MSKLQKVNFDTLSNGAALERADIEIQRVLENIKDPNTGFSTREVNVKIKIKPREDRASSEITIQATSKLAPVSEHITQVFLGEDADGNMEMSELVAQPTLFGEEANIKPMRKVGSDD